MLLWQFGHVFIFIVVFCNIGRNRLYLNIPDVISIIIFNPVYGTISATHSLFYDVTGTLTETAELLQSNRKFFTLYFGERPPERIMFKIRIPGINRILNPSFYIVVSRAQTSFFWMRFVFTAIRAALNTNDLFYKGCLEF